MPKPLEQKGSILVEGSIYRGDLPMSIYYVKQYFLNKSKGKTLQALEKLYVNVIIDNMESKIPREWTYPGYICYRELKKHFTNEIEYTKE